MLKSEIQWRAVDSHGYLQQGVFSGNRRHFKHYLQQQQLLLIHKKILFNFSFRKRFTQQQLQFTIDLAHLLSSDHTLIDSLSLLSHRYGSSQLKNDIKQLIALLQSGQSFSQTLIKFPQLVALHYLPLIKAAEKTQQLPLTFQRIVKQQQQRLKIHHQLSKAMIYPISILVFSLFICIGLLTFAIPQFQTIFNSFDSQLPMFTRAIIQIAHYLNQFKWIILLSLILCIAWLRYSYARFRHIKKCWQSLFMHLPWIKKLYRLKLFNQWCLVLASCLDAKLPLTQALSYANATITHITLQQSCHYVTQKIVSGLSLYQALSTTSLCNEQELSQIRLGEKSANLPRTLHHLVAQSTDQLTQQLENLSKWLEPVIMLFLSVVVGGLIISMYLPIFKIGTVL